MELGGNAPFLVMADADLDAAVDGAMLAKMRNMGEACTAANRFLVHEAVADEFAARMADRMAALRVGRGTEHGVQVGPLVDEPSRDKVAELVQDAVDGGAKVLTGGDRRLARLVLRAHRAFRGGDRGTAVGGDLRPGRTGDHLRVRRRSDRAGERHGVRPGRLRVHPGPVDGARAWPRNWTPAWSASTRASSPTRPRRSAA